MEIENVNAKANAGLATGIIGTAGFGLGMLGHLFNGGFGGFGGGFNNAAVNGLCAGLPGMVAQTVSRQELEHRFNDAEIIARKDSEIAELKMNTLMDSKVLDLYKYVEKNLHEIEKNFADQRVWNATQGGAIANVGGQLRDLENICGRLTKVVIPIDNVCPEPMARYNSWTAPVTAAAETPTA